MSDNRLSERIAVKCASCEREFPKERPTAPGLVWCVCPWCLRATVITWDGPAELNRPRVSNNSGV
jgi:hypothetical protein